MSVNGWRAGGGGGTSLGATLDTDGTLAANSDVKVASQKATKTYADTKAALAGAAFVGDVTTARLGAGSAAAWSTVEKLRVNTPVTASTTASTMLAAGTSAAIPVVIQGAAGHATDFFSVQNSAGTALLYLNSTGLLVQTGALYLGATAASTGQIRLPNNTSINWRNAANSADIGLNMNSSNLLTISASSIALAAAGLTEVTVDANGINMTDGRHFIAGTSTGSKIGSASTQKLGFWGATAVVQPTTAGAAATFTANAGTAVNDASTFDGYTLNQVVKALRTIGILA